MLTFPEHNYNRISSIRLRSINEKIAGLNLIKLMYHRTKYEYDSISVDAAYKEFQKV